MLCMGRKSFVVDLHVYAPASACDLPRGSDGKYARFSLGYMRNDSKFSTKQAGACGRPVLVHNLGEFSSLHNY